MTSAPPAPLVIGLIGKKRCGKDTIADYLVKEHGFRKVAYADPIKDAAKAIFYFSDEQLHGDELKEKIDPRWGISPRKALQLLGTDLMRIRFHELAPEVRDTTQSGFWVHRFRLWYQSWRLDNPHTPLVVSDARFQDEADGVLSLGGHVIRVHRATNTTPTPASTSSGTASTSTTPSAAAYDPSEHKTEKVDSIQGFSYKVHNDGTMEQLYEKVESILKQIRAKKSTADAKDKPT